jgi:hypothetical protein
VWYDLCERRWQLYYVCSVKYNTGEKQYFPYGTLTPEGTSVLVHGYTIVDLCKRIFDGKEKRSNYIIPNDFENFIKLLQYFYDTQYLAIVDVNESKNNNAFAPLEIQDKAPYGKFNLDTLTYEIF